MITKLIRNAIKPHIEELTERIDRANDAVGIFSRMFNRSTKEKKKEAMAKNVFIICTIRSATQEYLNNLENYVSKLESENIKVYAPHRDTNQMALGYEICKQNMQGIINADEVHIFYNSKSQGTHFDMGMAFALGKKIVIVENEPLTEGKSFQRMLVEWQQSA